MADFLARVELVNIGNADSRQLYEDLHEYMRQAQFSRIIQSSNGPRQLPDGTYVTSVGTTAQEVFQRAHAAAIRTGKGVEIIVAEMSSWWGNLPTP